MTLPLHTCVTQRPTAGGPPSLAADFVMSLPHSTWRETSTRYWKTASRGALMLIRQLRSYGMTATVTQRSHFGYGAVSKVFTLARPSDADHNAADLLPRVVSFTPSSARCVFCDPGSDLSAGVHSQFVENAGHVTLYRALGDE